MPNTNCCVPLYHAISKRHTQLSWHALPIDPKLNKQPTVAISNDTLKVNSSGTSEFGLHFQGERRTHNVNTRLRYSHAPFKTLFSKLFYVSHTNECCIFARRLLGVDCWNWQVTAYKAVRKLLGRPMQLLAVGSIDRFLPVRMCGFTSVTKLTLIEQANLTSLTRSRFMPCNKQPFKPVVSGTELSESQRCPIPVFIIVSNLRTSIEWLSATEVVKPRQLIQRVSASLVLLSTTLSGETAPFISTSRNKLTPPPISKPPFQIP